MVHERVPQLSRSIREHVLRNIVSSAHHIIRQCVHMHALTPSSSMWLYFSLYNINTPSPPSERANVYRSAAHWHSTCAGPYDGESLQWHVLVGHYDIIMRSRGLSHAIYVDRER